jgi:ABC-type phosphate transport system substrate-binding protein
MKSMFGRRMLAVGIASAASVAAFVLPSAASAALPGHCLGSDTEGAGATFPEVAQNAWKAAFNEAAFAKHGGCSSVKITAYRGVGSGAGVEEWSVKKLFGTVGFIGTDNTVNQAEKETIEGETDSPGTSKLMTVPIVEGAVAIVIHLPEHCKASASNTAPGRLALTRAMIKKIYTEGATWEEVEKESTHAVNNLEDEGGTCVHTEAITPVVRFDGSGTTHIFKESISVTDETAEPEEENGVKHKWWELAEGTAATGKCDGAKDSKLNECWPKAAGVVHAATKGNPGLLAEVAAKPSSIGYADLAQARTEGGFAPGGSPQKFWAVVEASQKKGKPKFSDPSSDGYSATAAESNCKKTAFQNPGGAVPPSVLEPWNRVSAKLEGKTYPICGATYMLVPTNYAGYASNGGNDNEAQTVKDYLAFITSKKGGAKVISTKDYFPLGTALAPKVTEALAKIEG